MKLHRMPLVVQRMIIEELGFDERLSLSFTSKRSCSLLGLFRNDLKGISIEIDIRTWDVSIRVRIPSYRLTERIFSINIRSLISNELKVDLPYKAYYMIGYSDYKIDGSTVQAVKYPSTIRIVLIENRVVRETNKNKSCIDFLKIVNYSWVDFSDLQAARVISMEIRSCEVNEVLKSWVAGRNRALEIGDFEIHRLMDMNREAIFNGITRHETQLTEAEIESFFDSFQLSPNRQNLRCIVAVDIVRKCDGMRATVIEGRNSSEPIRYMFVMVWSESNLRTIGRAND
ncbi:unnamed protein product [Caenorhabditis nigoni]